MKRFALILALVATTPAYAFGVGDMFPNLTYPTKTTPDVTKACTDPVSFGPVMCPDVGH